MVFAFVASQTMKQPFVRNDSRDYRQLTSLSTFVSVGPSAVEKSLVLLVPMVLIIGEGRIISVLAKRLEAVVENEEKPAAEFT